jgi:hypothetical protein
MGRGRACASTGEGRVSDMVVERVVSKEERRERTKERDRRRDGGEWSVRGSHGESGYRTPSLITSEFCIIRLMKFRRDWFPRKVVPVRLLLIQPGFQLLSCTACSCCMQRSSVLSHLTDCVEVGQSV